MGGFFHLVDLKQGRMARKIASQKKNVGGLEAPRNSLELPVESCHPPGDDGLHNYEETHDWSGTDGYPIEAPMKKLISDEISKRPNSKVNVPSIVARLMGVDTLPLDKKPLSREILSRSSSAGPALSPSKSFSQINFNSFHLDEGSDSDEWSSGTMSKKPKAREHPQEEELQKFKKEFEAWQSARFKECSKIIEHDTSPSQLIAQETLNNQKMTLYTNSATKDEKIEDLTKCHILKAKSHESDNSNANKHTNRLHFVRRKALSEDFDQSFLQRPDQEQAENCSPTRIVILRPGLDSIGSCEEQWASSSGASEERDSIEDFLEEVKERLKSELQGKTFDKGIVRGSGIETPYSEKLSDPKQIAQRIAKQVRESVTKDLGSNLLRSVSTRSYRVEFQSKGTISPEFISRDTRRLLSERLRNVLKKESHSISSTLIDDDDKKKSEYKDLLNVGDKGELSPMNLIRSLSAPVSGTSFGKLLLEDPHVVTGAHIRRKHEKVKKQRKEKFNLKEKVSSFKYNLTLRGRLFGRKIQSSEYRNSDRDFVKDIMNGSKVMMNFANRLENSTEVPPSPASVCSSIHEDFWRAAYCASPTTPGAAPSEDNDLPQAFRDISSNLNELRKKLNELETGRPEETMIEEQSFEGDMVELEDDEEAYIRDLLIASGLYDNSYDKSLLKWDTFAKPISNRIFEQVEESQKNKINDKERGVDHKVLLDLLNEVLSTILCPPMQMSTFMRKVIGSMMKPPCGNTLLDHVWSMLRAYLRPPMDQSFYFFDSMVARDLESMPWSRLVNEDVEALAKELECQIIRDLTEEIVNDLRDDRISFHL